MKRERSASDAAAIERAVDLLGGSRVFRNRPRNRLEVHDLLDRGLPADALTELVAKVSQNRNAAFFERAVGISFRTLQRLKAAPGRTLSKQQSGRAWQFAEIVARATEVLGSQVEAEQWLERPAMGLDQRRPIDLLATPTGVKLVEDFLGRLEHGVYV